MSSVAFLVGRQNKYTRQHKWNSAAPNAGIQKGSQRALLRALKAHVKTVVHACITSKLDYCNGLLYG